MNIQLTKVWKEGLLSKEKSFEGNVHPWFTKVTLDAIGEGMLTPTSPNLLAADFKPLQAAFDYQFGELDNRGDHISEVYKNMQLVITPILFLLYVQIFCRLESDGFPSRTKVAITNLISLLPRSLMLWHHLPSKGNKRLSHVRDVSRGIAERLLDEKWSVVDPSMERKDVMSLLGTSSHHQ